MYLEQEFLKQGLGREEMQIENLKGTQHLLAACFYVASCLYEMGKEKAYDDESIPNVVYKFKEQSIFIHLWAVFY